ncbi:SulP1 [Candidatus Desulfarcum epimagneticum]|uniref:SulP1 n=1 Tax=uncultured Desulfobacteraceae bacterium TaxID=218296 RepID=A0A484HJU7_9BACT|nr:SulP1 [uncultured Desulfobacteraceae bacterium]
MTSPFQFNRMEAAGSLGDLGTLLPIAMGMIMINGLSPSGLFFSIGAFYILSGLYFRTPTPVQPMKVIGAYAVAMSLSPSQISGAGLLMGLLLLIIGLSGAIKLAGRYIPRATVRGVQMSTGVLLTVQGVKFVLGTSGHQALQGAAEPFLRLQSLGPVPIGVIIGLIGTLIILFLLDSKKLPAALVAIVFGLSAGLILGKPGGFEGIRIGFRLPDILPFGFPTQADLSFALIFLVLPQLPMTMGNAVIANADLARRYFGEKAKKTTHPALCLSMGLANLLCFFTGGMPLCHGAGGLAAHYRFGARAAGSNLIIGAVFLCLALFLGPHALAVLKLIPFSMLGALLIFAGIQLGLSILDVKEKKDLFVVLLMAGVTLASNLAVGFGAGIVAAYMLQSGRLKV